MSLQNDFLSLFSPPFPASKEAAAATWATKLQPHMGGGGGGGWSLAALPVVPHPDDEEFSGDLSAWTTSPILDDINALDPYAAFSAGGCRYSLAKRSSWLLLQAAASGTEFVVVSKPVTLAPDVFVWTRMSMFRRGTVANNDSSVGFCLTAAADVDHRGDSIVFYLAESDGSVANIQMDRWVDGVYGNLSQSLNLGAQWNEIEYLGIHRRGTAYHFWIAPSSGQWRWVLSTTHAATLGRVSVLAANSVTQNPGNTIVGVDFIRFLEGGGPP